MKPITELEKRQAEEIGSIKGLFLRARGWTVQGGRWSSPRKPFTWLSLAEAYDEETALVRHWTSIKTRRAAPKRSNAARR